jgi:surface antigen
MTMRSLSAVSLFVALGAAASPASAQNWGPLMRNSPYERFNEKDNQMFLDYARKVLNDTPDNQTVSWQNPANQHGGDFTILKTAQKNGRTCKDVRVRTEADGRKGDAVLTACQVDGKWRLLSPPSTQ